MDKLPFLERPHYSNILIMSQEGIPLATISSKRADWYIRKGLAEEIAPTESYGRVLKLNFEPKVITTDKFSISKKENRCVVCGSFEKLSLHHVIPYCVKACFPDYEKNHTCSWCVLLCEEHHVEIEKTTRIYEPYLQNFQEEVENSPESKANAAIAHLYKMKRAMQFKAIPQEFVEKLLKEAIVFESINDVPSTPAEVKKKMFDINQKRDTIKKKWLNKFIEDNGGIEGVKVLFKNIFLKMEPKYLPNGFLEDHK